MNEFSHAVAIVICVTLCMVGINVKVNTSTPYSFALRLEIYDAATVLGCNLP